MANTGNTLLALITGAAIGAGIGLLYAPDTGENTRKKLKKDAQDAQDKLNKRYQETSSNLSDRAKKARVDFEKRLEETLSSASHKADDILAAMETKLEELRKQNAKLQKDKPGNTSGNKPDKAVV
ncbi:YtxH domain-containing protein [Gramella sp. KN1008]|uniref:YtxH domain-containing protein n=1 Tax=Gramella sp. KN1008 TaxID=2529298 RepID=UPI00103FE95B|nr:YtxH domain-containing protein [Gramella sp. KN1008]TBW27728.1 YtxH domain-containing protein [Gramella sp. KN1008]